MSDNFLDKDRYSEIFGFTYDSKAKSTKNVKTLLSRKKGICFDFVNYLFYKNDKKGDCYFIHFNNKQHNTHTFYFINGYLIECTPPEGEALSEKNIFIKKMTLKKEVESLVKQNVDLKHLDEPEEPPYNLIKYKPDNSEISIKKFIEKRFAEGGLPYVQEEVNYFPY